MAGNERSSNREAIIDEFEVELKMEVKDKWYFSRRQIEENSPSRVDGITLAKENMLRKQWFNYLCYVARTLNIPNPCIWITAMLVHRFFTRRSYKMFNEFSIVTACVSLSTKAGVNPAVLTKFMKPVLVEDLVPILQYKINGDEDVYRDILEKEKVVTEALDSELELSIQLPISHLHVAENKLKLGRNVLDAAEHYMHFLFASTINLEYKAKNVAAGLIKVAVDILNVELETKWWDKLEVKKVEVEEVHCRMLELIEELHVPPFPTDDPEEEEEVVEEYDDEPEEEVVEECGEEPEQEEVEEECGDDFQDVAEETEEEEIEADEFGDMKLLKKRKTETSCKMNLGVKTSCSNPDIKASKIRNQTW